MKMLKTLGWTLLGFISYYLMEVVFNIAFRVVLKYAPASMTTTFIVLVANLVLKLMVAVIFGIWYIKRERRRQIHAGVRSATRPGTILSLVGIGMLGQYALSFFLTIVKYFLPDLFTEYAETTSTISLSNGYPILTVIVVVIAGPIAEEVLFRGVIYGQLRDSFTVTQAAVISAAAFGIFHDNIIQGVYAAVFGMILAYVFEKTQTIWGSVLVHMMFNLSSYAWTGISAIFSAIGFDAPGVFYMVTELASMVVVVFCVCRLRRRPGRYENIGSLEGDTV